MSPTRRMFLLGTAGSCLLPRLTWAQQAKTTPHIGWISIETQPDPFIDGFREGLRRHGYVEGTNVILDLRYSPGNIEGLTAAVADPIQRKVLFIVPEVDLTVVITAGAYNQPQIRRTVDNVFTPIIGTLRD